MEFHPLGTFLLSAVPFALIHTDGSVTEINKNVLMAELENNIGVQLKMPQVTTSTISTADVFDVMALVHITQSFGASTFGEMALKYSLSQCSRI